MNLFIVFPVHLFKDITILKNYDIVMLIEEPIYFTDFNFHKAKLVLHRSTMNYYHDYLSNHNIKTLYTNFYSIKKDFYKNLSSKYNSITFYEPYDFKLENKLHFKNFIKINNPNFLLDNDTINYFKNDDKLSFLNFYKFQRKKYNILMKKNKPINDKWTFDKENRLPYKDDTNKLFKPTNNNNSYVVKAIKYVNKHFNDNYGSTEHFFYPINHTQSKSWLKNFIKNRFSNFGKYEDAILSDNNFLFHSVLSPIMNIGLITDTDIINEILNIKINIQSLEGFIRQIIGWRNYMLMVYILKGKSKLDNFFNHKNKLPYHKFWNAETGIKPVDDAILCIVKYGYCHHIIRLMVLGNFMLLCKINPNDVYTIFMEWTTDSYNWVMYGNVLMSQFCSENIITNRPYFSSSNYILKMSNYKKDDWCFIFDSLFYNFIHTHKKYLKQNYSTYNFVSLLNKKNTDEKNIMTQICKEFLHILYN